MWPWSPLNVALRKESVDRNTENAVLFLLTAGVALRKESVDRNVQQALKMMKNTESLSARRAWIEIMLNIGTLRSTHSRSPQGERG